MIWPLMIKIKCWCFCWKDAQNAKKIKKNATCAKYAKFAKPNLPKQSYHTIPKKQNMPNQSKPNLANQTYQAKSTRWPTNMDFFLLISRICDHRICIVRWKRLHVLRRGFVIFKIIDWIKAVNAWVRGVPFMSSLRLELWSPSSSSVAFQDETKRDSRGSWSFSAAPTALYLHS